MRSQRLRRLDPPRLQPGEFTQPSNPIGCTGGRAFLPLSNERATRHIAQSGWTHLAVCSYYLCSYSSDGLMRIVSATVVGAADRNLEKQYQRASVDSGELPRLLPSPSRHPSSWRQPRRSGCPPRQQPRPRGHRSRLGHRARAAAPPALLCQSAPGTRW